MALSQEQISRYSRHLILPEVGVKGQEKICNASVLCVGTGGLGSPLLLYLAAAGVGKLGIVDFDVVDESNLQRQIIHGEDWVGKSKVESARERIGSINSSVEIVTHDVRLTSENALDIIKDYDVVVDGTDNFATRFLVNDACVLLGKPNVYGSIFRFEGQASVFDAKHGPCYRCLYPEPPPPGEVPSCAEGGVLGILPGVIGVIQATEIVKIILGTGNTLMGRLLSFNALDMKLKEFKLRKDPDCVICSDHPTITSLIDYEEFCGLERGEEQVEIESDGLEITPLKVKEMLDSGSKFLLMDVREPNEFDICHIKGAKLIPQWDIKNILNRLDLTEEIVTYCHRGVRSLNAAKFLKDMGFSKVKSMRGGIDAWAQEIDNTIARY
jgi:molybdopterin/thiamine biosynthesis adenylyltransferase/rhodanese-related sulfurtransferase